MKRQPLTDDQLDHLRRLGYLEPTPAPQVQHEPRRRPGGALAAILIAAAIVVAYQIGGGRLPNPFDGFDGFDRDRQVDPDDDRRDRPGPDPGPDLSGGWIVIVEETQGRPPSRQRILDDAQLWDRDITAAGLAGWRRYDPDDPAAADFTAAAADAGVQPPAVLAITADGQVAHAIEFPDSAAAIRDLIQ